MADPPALHSIFHSGNSSTVPKKHDIQILLEPECNRSRFMNYAGAAIQLLDFNKQLIKPIHAWVSCSCWFLPIRSNPLCICLQQQKLLDDRPPKEQTSASTERAQLQIEELEKNCRELWLCRNTKATRNMRADLGRHAMSVRQKEALSWQMPLAQTARRNVNN